MKNISLKELVGKKIIWLNEDNCDCILLQTDDQKYYLLDAGRTKGLLYGPHLHECSKTEADEIVQDDPY